MVDEAVRQARIGEGHRVSGGALQIYGVGPEPDIAPACTEGH